ncbi:MAG TPA: hypothetical protein VFQ61_17120, partial [Polyangiaceae bacterium]|nr:hypothetical protein [Polyangiaceae bacterium]
MLAPMFRVRSRSQRVLSALLVLPALLGTLLASVSAARAADDPGWFDPAASQGSNVQGVQGGAVQGSSTSGAPAAASNQAPQEMPSLAPSPLITERRPTSSSFSGQASAESSVQVSAQDRDPRALSDFRPSLDPYGSWVNHPSYGTVWIPSRA